MTPALRPGLVLLLAALAPATAAAVPTTRAGALGGSLASMVRQNEVARTEQFAFVRTTAHLQALVGDGKLERVENSAHVRLLSYVHPYAQPEVRLLVERLGAQYHAATGRPMVVTSLVRPTAEQPSNAHRLSVHPAGMALDLRVPAEPAARRWLEGALLALEKEGVLDVTREYRPPHYHVAVFPAAYREYVAARQEREAAPVARTMAAVPAAVPILTSTPATAAVVPVQPAGPDGTTPLATVLTAVLLAGGAATATRRAVRRAAA
jgi:hypothetical protein